MMLLLSVVVVPENDADEHFLFLFVHIKKSAQVICTSADFSSFH